MKKIVRYELYVTVEDVTTDSDARKAAYQAVKDLRENLPLGLRLGTKATVQR